MLQKLAAAGKSRWTYFVAAAFLGFLLDVLTKEAAFNTRELQTPGARVTVVDGWFDIVLSVNYGAAWGLLWGRHTFFMIVSIVAFLAITFFVHTSPRRARLAPLVLGLVLAGVAGNFWDRVLYGHVRDFIDWHVPDTGSLHDTFVNKGWRTHWPTFNIADIFICVGAGALVVLFWKDDKKKAVEPPKDAPKLPEAEAPKPAAAAPPTTT